MKQFPSELLELIFSYLPNKQLCVCMKVCKSWYAVASEKRFEDINDIPSSYFIKKFQATRFDGRKAGDLVKKIYIWQFCGLSRDDFKELMYCLPNLRVLQGISPKYLEFLNDLNILDRLGHLEEIMMDEHCDGDKRFVDSFYALNIQLEDQITSLTLKTLPMCERGGDYKNLLTTLSRFRKLKKLYIGSIHQHDIEAINLTSILNACNSLVSLELQNSCNWEIDTEHNVIHKSLSSLKLSVRNFTENHLGYMVHHLPNLKAFKLRVLKNSFEEILSAVNPSTIEKFASYLKRLDHFEIQDNTPLLKTNDLDSSVKVLLFWKFLRDLCGKDCCCDLEICALSPTKGPRSIQLKKQSRKIYLQCDILLDSSNYESWVQQLDFLTFRTITLYGGGTNQQRQPSNHDQYNWVQSLIALLKQQQHKQVCCINIGHMAQKLEFGSTLQTRFRRESIIKYGYLSKIILRSEMLKGLGELYPFVESLRFEQCMVEKEKNDAKTYQIDLSQFGKLEYFTFDLDRMFPKNKIRIPLYLKFISTTTPDSVDYYYYREKKRALYHLGGSFEFTTTKSYFLVKIYHAGIEAFTFKRFYRNISVIKD